MMYHTCWQFLDFVHSIQSHWHGSICEGVYLTALPFMSAGKLVQAYVTTYVPRHSLPITAFLPERIELPRDYRVRIIFHACIRLISGLNDKTTSSRSQTSGLKKQIVVAAGKEERSGKINRLICENRGKKRWESEITTVHEQFAIDICHYDKGQFIFRSRKIT